MKPVPFSYRRPGTLEEALDLLAEHGDEAAVLAGGQTLMPMLAMRLSRPSVLIDINRVPGLDHIADERGVVRIGALVRYADLEDSAVVRERLPLVARALPHVAHVAVRNRGTIGGSLALADPAAEMPACAVALGAELVLASRDGRRTVAAEDYFQDVYETARRDDELLVEVRVPVADQGERIAFEELSRRHGDFAIVGLACRVTVTESRFRDPCLVFFGSERRPTVAAGAARALDGRAWDAAAARDLTEALAARPGPDGEPRGEQGVQAPPRPRAGRAHAGAPGRGRVGPPGGAMEETLDITLTVNGAPVSRRVPVRRHLVDFLRQDLGLTGSHLGCEHGVCGACTVRVDGRIVRGCLMLAVQADGSAVETVEGLTESGEIADLQAAFVERNALQCGYCTPGMLLAAAELLARATAMTRAEIRAFLSGNYCRCTGYQAIVDAVEATLRRRLRGGDDGG